MLKSVKFKNFKMFKNETFIDLVTTKSEILKQYNVNDGILRGGLIFGSNGSGKTTALHSISILLDMMFKEFKFPGYNICFFSKKDCASFEYNFIIDGTDIIYKFSVNKESEICEEKLIVDHNLILNRVSDKATTTLIENNDLPKVVDKKILYLRTLKFNVGFDNFPIINKWIKYLENSIYIDNISYKQIAFNQETLNETNLVYFLDKYGEDEINNYFNYFSIPYRIKYETQEMLGQRYVSIKFKNLVTDCDVPIQLESYGNRLLLALLPNLLSIKKNGGMLLVDEFGGGMHNKLNELIVNYLFKHTKNTQIFMVTHETNLLKTSIIRPDQVFIVDFDKEGSFISKASEQSPRESQNLEKMYLAGVFGGIPLYDDNK